MQIGVALFHSHIYSVCKKRWALKCIRSLQNQSFPADQTVYCELFYDPDETEEMPIFVAKLPSKKSWVFKEPMDNHASATNFCLNKLVEKGCDYLFLVHMDDYYSTNRFTSSINLLEKGYDLVSSDVMYIEENPETKNTDRPYAIQPPIFSCFNGKIEDAFDAGHNVIANPVVGMTRQFWEKHGGFDPALVPNEDFELYKRALQAGARYYIIPEILLYYRRHGKQACQQGVK
jgi:hypothetical protein